MSDAAKVTLKVQRLDSFPIPARKVSILINHTKRIDKLKAIEEEQRTAGGKA